MKKYRVSYYRFYQGKWFIEEKICIPDAITGRLCPHLPSGANLDTVTIGEIPDEPEVEVKL